MLATFSDVCLDTSNDIRVQLFNFGKAIYRLSVYVISINKAMSKESGKQSAILFVMSRLEWLQDEPI